MRAGIRGDVHYDIIRVEGLWPRSGDVAAYRSQREDASAMPLAKALPEVLGGHMFCILHISDLHRAATDPISNVELISALVSDSERYAREDPPIARPDAIIVSGDIIQGVGLEHPDFEAELRQGRQISESAWRDEGAHGQR